MDAFEVAFYKDAIREMLCRLGRPGDGLLTNPDFLPMDAEVLKDYFGLLESEAAQRGLLTG